MLCKVCDTDKTVEDFYPKDKTCKECRKLKVRKNRAEKAEYYRNYDRERFQKDPRVKQRHERYKATTAGREKTRAAARRWIERNAVKRAVHVVTGNAIKSRAIKKMPCEVCGAKEVHAHHDDYAKPLDVRWLCPAHHTQWHKENGEGRNA